MTAGVDLEDERIVIGAQKIFDGIENRMSLIHRTSDQATGREHVYGYEGTYRVNPKLLEALKIAATCRLLESSADLHDVRDFLGHANITTTSRYLRSAPVRLAEALQRMEASAAEPDDADERLQRAAVR